MKLSLQLSTYQSARFLPALFDSLLAQSDRDWTLCIRDDGSPYEDVAAMVAILDVYRDRLPHRWIAGENVGFAGSHQMMFSESDSDLVLLVNHDVILTPHYIANIRAVMESDSRIGAAEGVILRSSYTEGGSPVFTRTIDSLGLVRSVTYKVSDLGQGEEYLPFFERVIDRFGVSGCLPMYRRSFLGDVLFDPTFWMYKEDVDVAFRLRGVGAHAVMVSTAIAYHGRGFRQSLLHRGVSDVMQEHSYRNHWRILFRYVTWRDWLCYGWAILPFEAAKVLFMLLFHPMILFRTVSFGVRSLFRL